MAVVPTRNIVPSRELDTFSSYDHEKAITEQILATHTPDGREFDVKAVLNVVKGIFQHAAPVGLVTNVQHQPQLDDDKAVDNGFITTMEAISYTINLISHEISCEGSDGGDAHPTTMALFNRLSNYTWEQKVVLALAAFAVNYGEFWLVSTLQFTNPVAKAIASVEQLPDMLECGIELKPKFEGLDNLIRAILDIAKCLIEFKELPSEYITPEMLIDTAHIHNAVYWTIRSILACATTIVSPLESTKAVLELPSLVDKLKIIHEHLTKQLSTYYRYIDEKRFIEAYQLLVLLFDTVHIDNMKIIKALIHAKDDQLPLYDGSHKTRISVEVLKRKNVLLYISDLDLPYEELSILEQMYIEALANPRKAGSYYEVVWLPVVDQSTPWDGYKQMKFKKIQSMTSFYSVGHPSMLDSVVIKYIKEVWHFIKKPLLVVLDPQGKVVNPNAIHMMWIWGSTAFPFTSHREEALWREEEIWRIDLLVDGIDPKIIDWILRGKLICLYGGDALDWIRRFTTSAKAAAKMANIQLEMVYVGKSNPTERIRKITEIIESERLSHVIPDHRLIWYFWVRLESMWHSKVQHNRTVENDSIMQEIVTMLSFDGSDQGWAVIAKGAGTEYGQVAAKGIDILRCFEDFQSWCELAEGIGFVPALNDHLRNLQSPIHCNRLILSGNTGGIPPPMICAECGRAMDEFIMYRCCND